MYWATTCGSVPLGVQVLANRESPAPDRTVFSLTSRRSIVAASPTPRCFSTTQRLHHPDSRSAKAQIAAGTFFSCSRRRVVSATDQTRADIAGGVWPYRNFASSLFMALGTRRTDPGVGRRQVAAFPDIGAADRTSCVGHEAAIIWHYDHSHGVVRCAWQPAIGEASASSLAAGCQSSGRSRQPRRSGFAQG